MDAIVRDLAHALAERKMKPCWTILAGVLVAGGWFLVAGA